MIVKPINPWSELVAVGTAHSVDSLNFDKTELSLPVFLTGIDARLVPINE